MAAMTVVVAAMTMTHCMEFVERVISMVNLLRRETSRHLPMSITRQYLLTETSALSSVAHDIADRWKHACDGRDQDML